MAASLPTFITRRQTTFWDFLDAERASRVHFKGKKEFRAAEDEIASIQVVSEHPLLLDYQEQHASIYVAGVGDNPSAILRELQEALLAATSRWRDASTYLNAASEAVLTDGYGMLFGGPESLGKIVIATLSKAKVSHTVLPSGRPTVPVQVLVAGDNWVIAEQFLFEELPSNKSLERMRER
jgi:hypothetical protein